LGEEKRKGKEPWEKFNLQHLRFLKHHGVNERKEKKGNAKNVCIGGYGGSFWGSFGLPAGGVVSLTQLKRLSSGGGDGSA